MRFIIKASVAQAVKSANEIDWAVFTPQMLAFKYTLR